MRRHDVRSRLARDASLDTAWPRWTVLANQGRSAAERGLAPRAPVPSLPGVRATGDAAVRAGGRAGPSVPALLGLELREPVLELQGHLGPTALLPGIRGHDPQARTPAASRAGSLLGQAGNSLTAPWPKPQRHATRGRIKAPDPLEGPDPVENASPPGPGLVSGVKGPPILAGEGAARAVGGHPTVFRAEARMARPASRTV